LERIGTVVSLVPDKDGVTALDEYKIEFQDSTAAAVLELSIDGLRGLTNGAWRSTIKRLALASLSLVNIR
jgi:hypothetical protein